MNSDERRLFGTDGIRGAVGRYPVNAECMLKLGWAAGRVLCANERGRVLIGKDTRISGYMFESALEAGLIAAGVDVLLLGPMPTPAVAYLTRTFRARAGIVISASHNPYSDNGVKFFDADGSKLPDALEAAIEAELASPLATVRSEALGKAERISDAAGRYVEFCKSTIPPGVGLKGLRIVVDCAHGAAYHVAPNVFSELGAEVLAIGVEPNGLNINHEVGALCPRTLQAAVRERRADLGVALDGDGDRVVMVDEDGELLDGDEILFVIARLRRQLGATDPAVVGTVMSNHGLEEALAGFGVALHRAPVGDRHVLEMMRRRGCRLGGEASGHIICLDRVTTGDGIVAALQVLHAMRAGDLPLRELRGGMTKYPQVLRNVEVNGGLDPMGVTAIRDAVHTTRRELGSRGRVLLRRSGTEPLVRVMVEGPEPEQVEEMAGMLAGVVKSELVRHSALLDGGGSTGGTMPAAARDGRRPCGED